MIIETCVSKHTLMIQLKAILDDLSLSHNYIPPINHANNQGKPYLLVYSTHYEYVVKNGSEDIRHDLYLSRDEFIYQILKGIFYVEAGLYVLLYRKEGRDSETMKIERQIYLMRYVDLEWARRLEDELMN